MKDPRKPSCAAARAKALIPHSQTHNKGNDDGVKESRGPAHDQYTDAQYQLPQEAYPSPAPYRRAQTFHK